MTSDNTSINLDRDLKRLIQLRADKNFRSASGEINYIIKTFLQIEARLEIQAFNNLVSGRLAD